MRKLDDGDGDDRPTFCFVSLKRDDDHSQPTKLGRISAVYLLIKSSLFPFKLGSLLLSSYNEMSDVFTLYNAI